MATVGTDPVENLRVRDEVAVLLLRPAFVRELTLRDPAQVAEKMGPRSGTQNVTIETMTKIANAIGVKVADFFWGIEGRKARRGRGRPPKR